MSKWQQLAQRYPHATLIRDVSAYEDVFDAIAEAEERATKWEPSPSEYTVLGQIRGPDGQAEDLYVLVTPVVPVRVPNTVRLCIGLLQHGLWQHADLWTGASRTAVPLATASLPNADRLLNRKLQPTMDELVDLARFLVTPHPSPSIPSYSEPSAAILRLLERCVTPPAPPALADVLMEAKRRIDIIKERYITSTRKYRGKAQTKRFVKWHERLDRLLG